MKKIWILMLMLICVVGGFYLWRNIQFSQENHEINGEEQFSQNEKISLQDTKKKKEEKADSSQKKKKETQKSEETKKKEFLAKVEEYDQETQTYGTLSEEEILELAKLMSNDDIIKYFWKQNIARGSFDDWLLLLDFDKEENLEELRDLFVLYMSIINTENRRHIYQWENNNQPFSPYRLENSYRIEDDDLEIEYQYHNRWMGLNGNIHPTYFVNTKRNISFYDGVLCDNFRDSYGCATLRMQYQSGNVNYSWYWQVFEKEPNFDIPQTLTLFWETYTYQKPIPYKKGIIGWSYEEDRMNFINQWPKSSEGITIISQGYETKEEVEKVLTEMIQKKKSINIAYGIHFRKYPWIIFFYENKALQQKREQNKEYYAYFDHPLFIEKTENLQLDEKGNLIDMKKTLEIAQKLDVVCISWVESTAAGKWSINIENAYGQTGINEDYWYLDGKYPLCLVDFTPTEEKPLFTTKASAMSGYSYLYFALQVKACRWSVQAPWSC